VKTFVPTSQRKGWQFFIERVALQFPSSKQVFTYFAYYAQSPTEEWITYLLRADCQDMPSVMRSEPPPNNKMVKATYNELPPIIRQVIEPFLPKAVMQTKKQLFHQCARILQKRAKNPSSPQ